MTTERPRGLLGYIAGIAVLGFAGLAVLTFQVDRSIDIVDAVTLTGIATLSVGVPLRIQKAGGVQGFTLEEGVLVAMLVVLPAQIAPLLITIGAFVGHLLRSRQAEKIAFNVGQTASWATAGAAMYLAIGAGPDPLSPRTLLAVLGATVTLNVVSFVIMAGLFQRLERRPVSDSIRTVWQVSLVTWLGNTMFGLVLAILTLAGPLAAALSGALLIGLYLGFRGYATTLEERRRVEALHDVTSTLVEAAASDDALERFLVELSRLFQGGAAELLLLDESGQRRYRFDEHGVQHVSHPLSDQGPLAEALRRGGGVLVDQSESRTQLRLPEGRRNAIAAPVVYEGRAIGALAVFDRHGVEPWQHVDLGLLTSLAYEAAVAVKNVELFADVERERVRLAEESTKLNRIVDAASDGILLIGSDGHVKAWNAAMASIGGISTQAAVGQPWDLVLRLRDEDGRDVLSGDGSRFSRAVAGEPAEGPVEVRILRRDGSWRWLHCSVAPVGGDEGVVIVARDVTREREAEELKTDFIATISHELRTPMTPLKGFVETLRVHRERLDADATGRVVDAMENQIERLDTLMRDLIEVADLERGGLPMRRGPVDLEEAVNDAITGSSWPQDIGRVTVLADRHVAVLGDARAVRRIARALIGNALKHTGGDVVVRLGVENATATLEVIDEGPGIPPWEHERVFGPFQRLGDHLHRTQGPGLGLTIARTLAERMDGEIRLDSDVDRGSVFTLRMPVSVPHLVAVPDEEHAAS